MAWRLHKKENSSKLNLDYVLNVKLLIELMYFSLVSQITLYVPKLPSSSFTKIHGKTTNSVPKSNESK